MKNIFEDGKTFPDCLPKRNLAEINSEYLVKKNQPDFNLRDFVKQNFDLPKTYSTGFSTDASKSAVEHVHSLWSVLTRQPEQEESSLIPLPHAYIVPGGRFREIYYWDSYFTMLGLKASGRSDMIENMIDNFSFLIDRLDISPMEIVLFSGKITASVLFADGKTAE
jgi:Neutral trehalase